MPARYALFGGAFDPVHAGHLAVAEAARARFHLDRVIFVPSGNPPHKPLDTPFADRVAMLRLVAEHVSEAERGGARSYTYDMLQHFDPPRLFLIGADAFSEIESWYRWRDVIAMTEFIVASRPGHGYDVPAGAVVHRLETLAFTESSSAIRTALAAGLHPPELPQPVYDYIRSRGLYHPCVPSPVSS
ncbi:MAG: nicotinate (nicotinamide) nucleotide adenylyltransferase [Bryobacteraceae bacterium]|nr:nicotinate (nicotinamide) nucleotide adenylyltransferase [Bryobacteraceae bacterium]